jgi:hypothetical protein
MRQLSMYMKGCTANPGRPFKTEINLLNLCWTITFFVEHCPGSHIVLRPITVLEYPPWRQLGCRVGPGSHDLMKPWP